MPNAWVVATGQPIRLYTRLAVDFDAVPVSEYSVTMAPGGEKRHQLVGSTSALLLLDVRAAGSDVSLATLNGPRLDATSGAPAVLTWSGLDRAGRPVPPGVYEIEVRGRMVPRGAESRMREGAGYADLEGWADAVEACTRVLRIEVVDGTRRGFGISPQGTTCAAPPPAYYSTVDTSTPATLRATLHAVIDDHVRFPYSSTSTDTWDILNDADENPADPSTVLDLYKNQTYPDGCSSGCSWNREHTWAKSFGFQEESGPAATPYTDAHHLRATHPGYNSSRSNLPHGECTSGCSEYPTDVNAGFGGAGQSNFGTGGSISCTTPTPGQVWEVWDHRKGDVARSILYMDLRYEGGTGPAGEEPDLIATDNLALMYAETTSCGDGYQPVAYHGLLSDLLAWHAADPPDADEMRRNDQVWCYQQNRNPFVDHPEWVDCVYLGNCGGNPSILFAGIVTATDPNTCSTTGVEVTWGAPGAWNDDCASGCNRGFRVLRDSVAITTGGCAGPLSAATTSCTDTAGVVGTTYAYSVEAFNHESETSTGNKSISGADLTDDGVSPVITVGPSATSGATSITVTWTTNEASDSHVEYGLTTAYGGSTSNATLVTGHSLTISGTTAGKTYHLRVRSADACGGIVESGDVSVSIPSSPTLFFPLTPCRVLDTRNADGPYGGPVLTAGEIRTFTITGVCGVPENAVSIVGNLTVTEPSAGGSFRFWAGDGVATITESVSFAVGRTRANNLICQLATDGSGAAKIENVSAGTAHAILDVSGYFAPDTSGGPTTNQLAIRINEVDADQASTDTAEFVELVGPAGTSLDRILLVLHNGSSSFAAAGYRTQVLTGQAFPATPLSGGTKSLFVLGPAALAGFTAQPHNTLYSTGWPASNAVQNAGSNEGDGLLVAYDTNENGAYDDGVDQIIDKLAYVQSGGADGGSATAAGFKAIYGSAGSTYLGIDSTTASMGKNSDTIPAASGLTFNYTANNGTALVPSPGAVNPGQTNGL